MPIWRIEVMNDKLDLPNPVHFDMSRYDRCGTHPEATLKDLVPVPPFGQPLNRIVGDDALSTQRARQAPKGVVDIPNNNLTVAVHDDLDDRVHRGFSKDS